MTALNGKWMLTKSENGKAFIESLGYSPEMVTMSEPYDDPKNDVIEEYDITKEKSTERVYMKGKKEPDYEETVPIGTNVSHKDMDGKESKVTIKVEKNSMTSIQDLGDVVATYELIVDGDILIENLSTSKGVTAKRELKRVK